MFHMFGSSDLEDVSLYLCGRNATTVKRNQDVVQVYLGNQRLVRINSSMNTVQEDGGALESTDSLSLEILQCSFTHSSGMGIMSMLLRDAYLTIQRERVLSMVNVYNNTATGALGLINFLGPITLSRWVFIGNTGVHCAREAYFGPNGAGYQKDSWNCTIRFVDCVSDTKITGAAEASFQVIDTKILSPDEAKSHTMFLWQTKLCPGAATFGFTVWQKQEQCAVRSLVFASGFLLYSSHC